MELSSIIGQYVRARRTANGPLSISSAITAIRLVGGGTTLSDRELADLIAAAAIDCGLPVDFDAVEYGEVEIPARTGTHG